MFKASTQRGWGWGLIGSLAEPLCKVNSFPHEGKISYPANEVEGYEYHVTNYIVLYYWSIFGKKKQSISSDQMVLG